MLLHSQGAAEPALTYAISPNISFSYDDTQIVGIEPRTLPPDPKRRGAARLQVVHLRDFNQETRSLPIKRVTWFGKMRGDAKESSSLHPSTNALQLDG
ncbi:hypothetical protein KFE25_007143 [Diacronema lutheri]|uniref:Uncharacterized protein n=2 Tax=Diacronema lutheri TaxID=2081491 RepID=A0A8J5XSE1_DIALT|nr:hypothetical protein KFE25_007143 [Diacronema lutheri]